MSKPIVVIPARYRSTRYPGKPLVEISGRKMILRVADIAAEAVGVDSVIVATEDDRIREACEDAGYRVVMTSAAALTGTDRIAEVAESVDAEFFVNVQGDEPMLDHADIVRVIEAKRENPDAVINAYCRIGSHEDPASRNLPKVVFNESESLLYMSRSLVPGSKESRELGYHKQVCIYAFNHQELRRFSAFGRKSALESVEDIEILRFLEVGIPVKMIKVPGGSLAVDEPEDVSRVEVALARRHGH